MVGKRHVHKLNLACHKGSYLQRDGHIRAGYRRLKYLNILTKNIEGNNKILRFKIMTSG